MLPQCRIPTFLNILLLERVVSFSEFHDLIIEAQEFINFGFNLNRTLRIAIMKKRTLFDDVEHVTEMIKEYKRVVERLLPPEVK